MLTFLCILAIIMFVCIIMPVIGFSIFLGKLIVWTLIAYAIYKLFEYIFN